MNYTIKHLADLFDITSNKIRFYEEKGLLKPHRHPENDYRIYDESHVLELQTLLMYRGLGLSIEQIGQILHKSNSKTYLDTFNNLWSMTNKEIHRLSSIRRALEGVMDTIYESDVLGIEEKLISIFKESQAIFAIKNSWSDQWAFDHWAKNYDKSILKMKNKKGIYQSYDQLLDSTADLCSNVTGMILDIGVGTGNLSKRLLDVGKSVVGVDQSREMLSVVKSKIPSLIVRLGDFMNLPFDNAEFDGIVSTYAFHHLNDEEKTLAIDEMFRVLKPGGQIVIGDMMFKNNREKEIMISSMSERERFEVEDEYYTNIEKIEGYIHKKNSQLTCRQIDDICWIVVMKK